MRSGKTRRGEGDTVMPRTRSLAWAELKIGLISVFAIVMTLVLIFLLSGEGGFSWQQYGLKTRFDNIAGLKPGAPVRVAGVEVGSVTAAAFDGDRVDVSMKVNEKYRHLITSESVAVLGGKVVPFEFAGVASSANSTGHRFLGKSRVAVSGPRDYAARLRANAVMARHDERRKKIEAELEAVTRRAGVRLQLDLRPGVNFWYHTAVINGTRDWTLHELKNIVITEDREVVVKLENFGNPSGTAWFDDVRLEEQEPEPVNAFLLYPNFRGMLFDDRPQTMRIDVTVTPPGDDFAKYSVRATLADESSGAVVRSQTYEAQGQFVAELDGSVMQPGKGYLLRVSLVDKANGATVYTYPAYRVSRVPGALRASMNIAFDEKNRLLVRGKNINQNTLLATDYLNHFNEIIMLLEMVPSMPECYEDAAGWRPKSYAEHFRAAPCPLELIYSLGDHDGVRDDPDATAGDELGELVRGRAAIDHQDIAIARLGEAGG